MAGDAGTRPNISAAMRREGRSTLAMLSSHAGKAARAVLPQVAADGRIPARRRRKHRCRSIGRRGVGMAGDRVNAIRVVGTIGVTEHPWGVNAMWSGTMGAR